MSDNNIPTTTDEWQRALDAPMTQADLQYIRDNVDPSLVRDAGLGPSGGHLLASSYTKREVWTMVQNYSSHFFRVAPAVQGEDAGLRARYPTMYAKKS